MKRFGYLGAATALFAAVVLVPAASAQTTVTVAPPAPSPLAPGVAISVALENAITGTAPASVSVTVDTSTGGVVVAGNSAVSFPPGAFGAATGNVNVAVTSSPNLAGVNQGGAGQFSPNGTVMDISVSDSSGAPITTFPQAVTIVVKPNAADLAMANGNFSLLTMFYVIDANSPAGENPDGFPVGTRTLVPPSVISTDPTSGYIGASLNFIGSVLGVGTNPVGWVETTNPNASLLSSFNTSNAQTFGTVSQFTPLQVTEPSIGTTLLVLNPATGNYAYVNASDVGPSGPPASSASTAVVRGLLGDS